MPISFQCSDAERSSKHPTAPRARSSTCPGCGGTVTCPEPDDDGEVVEMQLTPVKPKGFDPFADVDSDKPYGVATPDPIRGSRAPTMPTLKRARKDQERQGKEEGGIEEHRSLSAISHHLHPHPNTDLHCLLVYCPRRLARSRQAGGRESLRSLGFFVIVMLITGLAATVFAFLLTMKISNVGMAILVLVLSFVPCVGLIALLVVSGMATKRLRNAGIDVGFLGADMSAF